MFSLTEFPLVSGWHLPAFWAQPPHTKRPLPHRYLQLRWRKTGIGWEISLGFHTLGNLCSADYAGSLGIWNPHNSLFQGLLSKLKPISVVKLDILNFLLVGRLWVDALKYLLMIDFLRSHFPCGWPWHEGLDILWYRFGLTWFDQLTSIPILVICKIIQWSDDPMISISTVLVDNWSKAHRTWWSFDQSCDRGCLKNWTLLFLISRWSNQPMNQEPLINPVIERATLWSIELKSKT